MDSPMGSFKAFSFGENAPVYEDPLEEEEVISPVPSGVGSRRQVVSAETYNAEEAADGFVPPVNPKNEQDVRYLTEVLSKHGLFKHLDDREVQVAVNAMFRRDYNKGDFLSKKGDQSSENDTFHVITSGSCSIIENEKKIKTLNPGDTYGELEMLYQQPRASTVYCEQHVSTWALDRKTYTHIMHNTFIKKRALYTEFLAKISFLQSMSHKELIQLADALQPDKFKKGEHLISYGEEGTWFYIIVEGVVEVWGRNEKGEKIPVCTFTRGDCVGELEFLHNHNTVADVVAQTDEVRVAKLNRQHFEMCMGPIKELLKQSRAVDPVFSYYRGTQGNETQQQPQPHQLLQPQPQLLQQIQPNQQIPQQLLHLQQQQQQQALFDKQFGNYKDITITPRVDFQITSNDLTPRYTSIAPAYNGSSRTGYSTSLVPYQAPTYTYDAPFGAPDFLFGAPTYTTPYHHPTMYSAHTYTHPLPDFGFYPHGPAPTYLAPQSYFPQPPPPSRLPPSLAYRPHVDDFLPYPHPSSYAYSGYSRRSHPFEYDYHAPLYSPASLYGPTNDFHHHVPSYALNTPRRFAAPPLYDDYNRFSNRPPIHHLFSSQYTAPSPVWSRPFY